MLLKSLRILQNERKIHSILATRSNQAQTSSPVVANSITWHPFHFGWRLLLCQNRSESRQILDKYCGSQEIFAVFWNNSYKAKLIQRESLPASHTLHAAILLLLLPTHLWVILSMWQICYSCYRHICESYSPCGEFITAVTAVTPHLVPLKHTFSMWVIYYQYYSFLTTVTHLSG